MKNHPDFRDATCRILDTQHVGATHRDGARPVSTEGVTSYLPSLLPIVPSGRRRFSCVPLQTWFVSCELGACVPADRPCRR
jgi:hypothetical protein